MTKLLQARLCGCDLLQDGKPVASYPSLAEAKADNPGVRVVEGSHRTPPVEPEFDLTGFGTRGGASKRIWQR